MEIRFIDTALDTWLKPREIPPRSEGRHVSSVILDMLKRIDPRRYESWGKRDGRQAVYEPGYLWEDVMSAALRERAATLPAEQLVAPVELHRDAIYGTPDRLLFDLSCHRWIVEETKFTWMSSRKISDDPEALFNEAKFSYWFLQAKTYGAMLDRYGCVLPTRDDDRYLAAELVSDEEVRFNNGILVPRHYLTLAIPIRPALVRIRSLHAMGNWDWTGEFPKPLAWEIELSDPEFAAHWASILRFESQREGAPNVDPV